MNKYSDSGAATLESMSQAGWYNQWTLNKFKQYLIGDILEVGCGIGNFSQILAEYGQVTAIDIDPDLVKKIHKNDRINAGFGDIEKGKYFFQKKTFDTITCINVLEHIKNDEQALYNMYKLLKKDGKLILLVPIHQLLYGEIDRSIGHFRRYNSKYLVNKISKMGMKICLSRKLNFIGAIGWFLSGRILKSKAVTSGNIRLFNLLSPFLVLENIIETPVGTSVLIVAQKA